MADPIQDPGNINNLNAYADLKDDIIDISNEITRIIKNQQMVGVEATNARSIYRDINKHIKNLIKLGDDWNNALIKQKDILRAIRKIDNELKNLRIEEVKARRAGNIEMEKAIQRSIANLELQYSEVQALHDVNKELEKRLGITGAILKSLKSVPILGDLLQIDEAVQAMNLAAQSGENSFKVAFVGVREALDDIFAKVSFGAIMGMLIKTAFEANKQATMFGKTMLLSETKAMNIQRSFANTSLHLKDNFITTEKIVEANTHLMDILGLQKVYSKDILVEFINLTKRIGISEESASGLARMSVLTGKTLKATKNDSLEMSQAISAQYGVQLNNKKILDQVGKVSGQLLANFKANPKAIAEAIAQAEVLGTTLDTARKQGEYLLDFESSIESELKSELLIGQSMNLERARAAALMGDQLSVMKELNNQGMNFSKFQKLNVLQQQSFAQALGLTSDELSNQLMQQEFIGKSRAEIVAMAGEDVAKRMEQLSAQEKFNAAIEKMKDLLVGIASGPLGQIISMSVDLLGYVTNLIAPIMQFAEGLGNVLNFIGKIYNAMGPVGKLLKGLTSLAIIFAAYKAYASLATIPIAGPILGAAAAAAVTAAGFSMLNSKAKDIQDGYIDPKKDTVISSPMGTYKTHEDDKIIVGTNIGMSDKSSKPLSSSNIDMTPVVNAIAQLRVSVDRLYTKEGVVLMDGRKVGTTMMQGTSKLA